HTLWPGSILDLMDQFDQTFRDRHSDAARLSLGYRHTQLSVDLRATLAHGEVPPDSTVTLRRSLIVLGQRSERLGGLGVSATTECFRLEAVERFATNAFGGRNVENFPGQRNEQRPITPQAEAVRDRFIGQGGGEQQRAIRLLAPQKAPDVLRQLRPLVKSQKKMMQRANPFGGLPGYLADDDGAVAAVLDQAG